MYIIVFKISLYISYDAIKFILLYFIEINLLNFVVKIKLFETIR